MTISAIKQQVKNQERASIFINGKYSFSLSLNELVAERLKVGQELEKTDIDRLKKLSDEGKLKMKALSWVLIRPHSEKEFRDYLYRKKADPELINLFAEDFTQRKYLDDESFAGWWIESRRGSKMASNRKLVLELRQKGVDRSIIDKVMSVTSPEDEIEALRKLAEKKKKLSRYQAEPKKLISYLMSQGYSYELVSRVLLGDD